MPTSRKLDLSTVATLRPPYPAPSLSNDRFRNADGTYAPDGSFLHPLAVDVRPSSSCQTECEAKGVLHSRGSDSQNKNDTNRTTPEKAHPALSHLMSCIEESERAIMVRKWVMDESVRQGFTKPGWTLKAYGEAELAAGSVCQGAGDREVLAFDNAMLTCGEQAVDEAMLHNQLEMEKRTLTDIRESTAIFRSQLIACFERNPPKKDTEFEDLGMDGPEWD